ncbi:hypothetical protein DSOL_1220 [Desulfosporosinus metallidurans]|uniref:Uncharacterized protein n=1 Tax=Desulfosporosinus metallidurans TaxID=1888891 RepID=A0A1Q8QZK2_9FIRM|nr:hypothetical protein DSOL_1220 [Desulfosporosinus metallidurans]
MHVIVSLATFVKHEFYLGLSSQHLVNAANAEGNENGCRDRAYRKINVIFNNALSGVFIMFKVSNVIL